MQKQQQNSPNLKNKNGAASSCAIKNVSRFGHLCVSQEFDIIIIINSPVFCNEAESHETNKTMSSKTRTQRDRIETINMRDGPRNASLQLILAYTRETHRILKTTTNKQHKHKHSTTAIGLKLNTSNLLFYSPSVESTPQAGETLPPVSFMKRGCHSVAS